KIQQLDTAIEVSARTMGLEYVDIYDASEGHELCKGDPGFLNGIDILNKVQSFHPTFYGHGVIADKLKAALKSRPFGNTFFALAPTTETITVHQDETVSRTFTVPAGEQQVSFSTTWPGSKVVMTVHAPDGSTIDPGAAGVYHRAGDRQELY